MKAVSFVRRQPPIHWVGDGFPVRTLFSYDDDPAAFSPFLLLDFAGPQVFAPASRPRGVGSHPHRGFETVSIVYDGEVSHRDSTGAGGTIGPGDVQWMRAAAGIVHEEFHSERFTAEGGLLRMVQLWVNLPARHKMDAPGYQSITAAQIPTVPCPGALAGSARARLIAGQWQGETGPAQTCTPMQVWDLRLPAGSQVSLPAPAGHTALVLVVQGQVHCPGEAAADAGEGELIALTREGEGVLLQTQQDSSVLWLSGQPLDEPVVGYGPFVMNTRQEIRQALTDWQSGRLGR